MDIYAHTKENCDPEQWQPLSEHLQEVADRAAGFAEAFNAAEWGRIIGLTHDIGKHSKAFQNRLTGENKKSADHKGIGARLLSEWGGVVGRIGAYCIAGHHGGLPDYYGTEHGKSLEKLVQEAAALPDGVANPLEALQPPALPFALQHPFEAAFFTRMLFSALVDADFLDTERFMDPEKSSWRVPGPGLEELATALDRRLAGLDTSGPINALRTEILHHCRNKATLPPGLFTLTVPTGGGKTLTSMAFALDHARRHGLRRIVYVIPYTSIIEQNAQVFRDIFPSGSVIEHHSTFDARRCFAQEGDNARESAQARRHRLACENWDAPVVVTTNVQFFESLFGARPSQCRKLHNLAGSVIILDEAQMLPVKFLDPCLRALEALVAHYGASVVLCTATQPALRREDFSCGLAGLDQGRELAPDPERLAEAFARTRLVEVGEKSLEDVADMVREREQVLCIVNTRRRAARLFELVRDEPGAQHLSALMCPAHRTERLARIREMLRRGEKCRVVSTQLVEAGVDVSFPEVIREVAGLDSIAQAAGRCNREGESRDRAPVSVFIPSEGIPRAFSTQAGHTGSVLRTKGAHDPFSPEAIRRYFKLHYWLESDRLDEKSILKKFSDVKGEWGFRSAAKGFRLIENTMVPMIIPRGAAAEGLVRDLRYTEHAGAILRRLQQYTVQIYAHEFEALEGAGAVEWIADAWPVLANLEWYDEALGLTFPDAPRPEDFQV